ncbi:MBL fold metallo-hydrolase [Tateyamaria omphalii]|nr:MBL fold metallo-hydrolase [Tateyamaria omphalii]
MTYALNRRALLQGATITAGAAGLIRGSFAPTPARAQGALPAGTVHAFVSSGVTFHTYVSPPQAVSVTSHVIELGDQILLVDATFLPPTAAEVAQLVASTGKPIHTAYVSHEHPDHWGGVSTFEGVEFVTLPDIREGLRVEATSGEQPEPTALLNGGDLALGMTDIGGVPIEFRAYENAEAPKAIVAVLPEQRVAVVQDLVYNGIYFAPGVDRKNWIATLEALRDDPAFDTLLVGHGLPTTRGELDTAIGYLKTLDAAWEAAATPDDVVGAMKAAYPGYGGAFLLGLTAAYWDK